MAYRSLMKNVKQLLFYSGLLVILSLNLTITLSAQDWEVVREENFNDFATGLQGLDSYSSFILGNYGASGQVIDYCATANSYIPNCYIAFQEALTDHFEYRLRLNVKILTSSTDVAGNLSGKFVGFYYDPLSPEPYLGSSNAIGSNHEIFYRLLSDTGDELISEAFTISNGTYWLTAGFPLNTSTGGTVRYDNFILERRLLEVDPPSFTLTMEGSTTPITEVEMEAGQSVTLCLTPDENPTQELILNVTPDGIDTPHFEDYIAELTFPVVGMTEQCFVLDPALANPATDYTFNIGIVGGALVSQFNVSVQEVCGNMAGPDVIVCEGSRVQIGTGCLPLPHPIEGVDYCYVWEPSDDLYATEEGTSTGEFESMPYASPPETTTYTLNVTNSEGDLIASDEVIVTVNSIGGLSINSSEGTNLCDGEAITLTAILEGGNIDDYQIEWSTSATSPSIMVTSGGTYNVTISQSGGCSTEATITLEDITSDPLIIEPANPVICDESVTLTANEGFGDYRWVDPAGEDYEFGRETIVEEPGIYTLHVISLDGCTSSQSVTVEQAITNLVVTPNPAFICQGQPITLTAPSGYTSYVWLDAYEEPIGNQSSIDVDVTGTYSISVTDANGCSKTEEIDVDESPSYDLEILPEDPSFCFMGDPTIQNPEEEEERNVSTCAISPLMLDLNGTYVTVNWSTGDITPSLNITEPGIYSVTVTDQYGCTETAETEVDFCTGPDFLMEDFLANICPDETSITLDAGAEFFSYTWSDGSNGQTLEVSTPGDYGVTVEDNNGCKAFREFTVSKLDGDVAVDLELYKPEALAGNTTTMVAETDEETIGGMCLQNTDNDDDDKYYDYEDEEVKNGDNDLMRLKLKYNPGNSGNTIVKLLADQGEDDVKIWKSADKKEGEYTFGDEIELSNATQEGDFLVLELWVEGVNAHSAQQGTILKLICTDDTSCSIEDKVAITVLGLKELEWKGIDNGYGGPSNLTSATLDIDPNFTGATFSDDVTPMDNFRVFTGGRYLGGLTVSDLKDKVKLCVSLSVVPTEPITLYLRAFDIDDPNYKDRNVDPNDKSSSKNQKDYPGTNTDELTGKVVYTKHNDNRGTPENSTFKAGYFLDDTDNDEILELNFDDVATIEVMFQTSIFAGDNYRAATSFNKNFLENLVNIDKKHDLKIVSPNTKNEIPFSQHYTSDILTVWRFLLIEFQSMKNLDDANNRLSGNFTDFKGKRLSTSKEAQEMDVSLEETPSSTDNNPPSLTLDYSHKWHGRFENGTIYIGGEASGISIPVVSNGKDFVRCANNGMLPLPFVINDNTGTTVVSGQVIEVFHPSNSADYIYSLDVTSGADNIEAITSTSNHKIKVADGEEVLLKSGNATDSKVVSAKLSINFHLYDRVVVS
jgi:hypothetical protein